MTPASLPWSRRQFLSAVALGGVASAGAENRLLADSKFSTMTGTAPAELQSFDTLMSNFLVENNVPGASLAVTRRGQLLLARGYGLAQVERRERVAPTSLFRIASVSKPLTAVAILQLVEQGKLRLQDRVMQRMAMTAKPGFPSPPDPRWNQITIRHCLQHTGGWDRDRSGDPIGQPRRVAEVLEKPLPVSPEDLVRYLLQQPLDFTPGERYAYSNVGYLVLGRVIESVSGESYEGYVKKHILQPLRITTARLGKTFPFSRAPNEVEYYDPQKRMVPGVIPPVVGTSVPIQYGGENFDAFESHGGWIASAIDLVKFASAFDDRNSSPLLKPESIKAMWERPEGSAGTDPNGAPLPTYYGCGWSVRPVGRNGQANTWHTGLIAGSGSLLVRRWDGLNWAVLFNTHANGRGDVLTNLIDGPLHGAADAVKSWPAQDLFPVYQLQSGLR